MKRALACRKGRRSHGLGKHLVLIIRVGCNGGWRCSWSWRCNWARRWRRRNPGRRKRNPWQNDVLRPRSGWQKMQRHDLHYRHCERNTRRAGPGWRLNPTWRALHRRATWRLRSSHHRNRVWQEARLWPINCRLMDFGPILWHLEDVEGLEDAPFLPWICLDRFAHGLVSTNRMDV